MRFIDKRILFLLLLNFIWSLFLSFFYIVISAKSFIEYIFLLFAVFSNTFMIYITLLVMLFPFLFLKSRSKKYVFIFFFSFFHIINVVDIVIYKFWDFHINPMVLNIIFTPGGIESLNQSFGLEWILIFLITGSVLVEIFIWSFSGYMSKRYNFSLKGLIFFLILFVSIDKLTYAFSSLYDYYPILRHRNTLPLYQPLTIRSFASKYLGFDLSKRRDMDRLGDNKNIGLSYPKNDIIFDEPKKFNFLIIVIDSMRYDMLNSEVTPHIFNFSKNSFNFKNHYSGGNATRFGIFSIFYSIYGSYWFDILAEKKSPVLIDVLKKQGYNFAIFSSTKLTFPEFRKTCFVDIDNSNIYDNPIEGDGAKRDSYTTENVINYFEKYNSTSPFFVFVFFDAPHGSYDYVSEFEKFRPSHGINLFKLNKENVLPLFNKYKNSIYFDDYLTGKIISSLRTLKKLNNTVVIITADHGEAFFEKGYYGHNHSYSDEEIKVPLIFYIPGSKPKDLYHKTSHLDIVPTILNMLTVKNEVDDYSQGRDLFVNNGRRFITSFSWDSAAIIYDDLTVVVPLSSYGGFIKVYRNNDWSNIDLSASYFINDIKRFKEGLVFFKKAK